MTSPEPKTTAPLPPSTTGPLNRTPIKIALFIAVLAVVLLGSIGIGRLVGPGSTNPHAGHDAGNHQEHGTTPSPSADGHDHEHGPTSSAPSGNDSAPGTTASSQGYSLTLLTPEVAPGRQAIAFVLTGPDGNPVTDYTVVHEKELHLIAVRDDLTGFNHIHPVRGADGQWTGELNLTPGIWRIYTDTQPTGLESSIVLGAQLTVTGTAPTTGLPAPATTATVDGYEVTLTGTLAEGEQMITMTITRNGQPITDLEPYLGANAHVVVLRSHDLAYSHVHPMAGPPGPEISTHINFPSNGQYRAYIEFQHRGALHRAEMTLDIP